MGESRPDGGEPRHDVSPPTDRDLASIAPMPGAEIEDVVWSHDAGVQDRLRRYDAEAADWALTILQEVRAEEPAVTVDVRATAAEIGGTCHGLAFRMKAPDSLARKLHDELRMVSRQQSGDQLDVEAIARYAADDALRYTIVLTRHEELPRGLELMIRSLRARGWEPIEVKDSYLSGNSYQGLHLIARTPARRVIEVQLHSVESIRVKESIHEVYEIARDRDRSRADRRAADRRCVEASRQLPSPAGLVAYYPEGLADDSGATGLVESVRIRKKAYTRREGGAR